MFQNVTLSGIRYLIETLISYSDNTKSFVRTVYERNAQHLDSVILCAEALKLIHLQNDRLQIHPTIDVESIKLSKLKHQSGAIDEIVFEKMLRATGPIKSEIDAFFQRFNLKNGEFTLKRTMEIAKLHGPLRDIFLELGVLDFDENMECFLIKKTILPFLLNRLRDKVLNPAELERILTKTAEIGLLAEKEVVNYERRLLSDFPKLSARVVQTSLENTMAGYDIKSYELPQSFDDAVVEKYIEVKAVSPADWQFHWSKNEISVAERLLEQYYLYLVPVGSKGKLSIERLKMIQNPFVKIIRDQLNWVCVPESFVIGPLETEFEKIELDRME